MKAFLLAVSVIVTLGFSFAFAQELALVDSYLRLANELPFQIRQSLNDQSAYDKYENTCLKLKTYELVADVFKSGSMFARAASSKDPWTTRNTIANLSATKRLWSAYCRPAGMPRLALAEAKAQADRLVATNALESARVR